MAHQNQVSMWEDGWADAVPCNPDGSTRADEICGFMYQGEIVWRFDYQWIDDYHWNLGYNEFHGYFIGTVSDFREFAEAEEFGQGFGYWCLVKRCANAEEFAQYAYEMA